MRGRLSGLLVLGLLLTQAAWLLSVPAFRGLDEFDHVYRAAAVARGQWLPSGETPARGRGELVTVPRDLVSAAGPECERLAYTGHDNCNPVDGTAAGAEQVQVATAASRYHPAYYWLVGTAALPFEGVTAVTAMRVVSAVLCALFLALAFGSVRRWARGRWPVLALLGACTPVVLYSSIVVAPNALEIVAGISLWAALAGLCVRGLSTSDEAALLLAAVPGAVVLATVRTLGIAFLALTALVVVGLLGRRRLLELLRRQARLLTGAVAVVAAAVLGGLAWVVLLEPNRLEEHLGNDGALAGSLVQLPVWVLQSVAAAPSRSHPAPGLTYLLCGGLLLALVVAALRSGERRLGRAVLGVGVLSLVLPLALTLATFRDVGVVWQGRYGLPFSAGVLLLAGLALDRARPRSDGPRRWLAAALVAAYAVGQTLAVLHVLAMQTRVSPSVEAGLWSPAGPWLVGTLMLAGWGFLGLAATAPVRQPAGVVAVERAQERLVT